MKILLGIIIGMFIMLFVVGCLLYNILNKGNFWK